MLSVGESTARSPHPGHGQGASPQGPDCALNHGERHLDRRGLHIEIIDLAKVKMSLALGLSGHPAATQRLPHILARPNDTQALHRAPEPERDEAAWRLQAACNGAPRGVRPLCTAGGRAAHSECMGLLLLCREAPTVSGWATSKAPQPAATEVPSLAFQMFAGIGSALGGTVWPLIFTPTASIATIGSLVMNGVGSNILCDWLAQSTHRSVTKGTSVHVWLRIMKLCWREAAGPCGCGASGLPSGVPWNTTGVTATAID